MKIISIGPAHPYRGGIAMFNESFALTCKSIGHEIEIVSFKYLYPSFIFPGKSQFSEKVEPRQIIIHSLIHSLNPFNWAKIARWIASRDPDFVVIHYWMPFFAPSMGTIARKIRKTTNTRIIAVTHNLIPHEKQPGSKILTRFFLKSIDGIVALSSSVIIDYDNFKVPGKAIKLFHPIYNMYGEKLSRKESLEFLRLDPSRKYLLFFGMIRKYKGLELLINAFSLVLNKELILIVAGEFYENKDYYLQVARNLGVLNRIIFTDRYIPDEEVKYYFSVAETVVQPYLSATQSGVTQIAYQFDCPMVVTNVGGLPEIVTDGKTGFICNQNAVDISAAIEKSLDPDIHSSLVKGVIEEKHRFSWVGFVESMIASFI